MRLRWMVGSVGFLCASAMLHAQQPGAPYFRSEAQLVDVDVVATDARGKVLSDLKESELHVFEDGKLRPTAHFSMEHVQAINAIATDRLHKLAMSKKPDVYANFTAQTAGIPTHGCTLLLIDWLNTPVEMQPAAQKEFERFIASVDLSKPLAIYSLDSSLHELQGFTTDREALRSAVVRNGVHNANLQPEKRASRGLDTDRTDWRVQRSTSALIALARNVQGLRGHKSLIWLSGSFPAAMIPTNRQGLTPPMEASQGGWLYGERRDYGAILAQAARVLASVDMAVYPVDANGLQTNMADASQFSVRYYLNPITQDITQRQQAMRDAADLTGGVAFYNHNDISRALAAAYADASNFYDVSFTPASKTPDGKLHTIRVESTRAGVHLRYRKSYFADPTALSPSGRKAALQSLARDLGQAANGVPLMASLSKEHPRRVEFWIDGSGLTFSGTNPPQLRLDVALATFDQAGTMLQDHYAEVLVKMRKDQVSEAQASGLTQSLEFQRGNNTARIRLAVRDLISGKVGTLDLPLH